MLWASDVGMTAEQRSSRKLRGAEETQTAGRKLSHATEHEGSDEKMGSNGFFPGPLHRRHRRHLASDCLTTCYFSSDRR